MTRTIGEISRMFSQRNVLDDRQFEKCQSWLNALGNDRYKLSKIMNYTNRFGTTCVRYHLYFRDSEDNLEFRLRFGYGKN
jgi:uncharacterized protein YllA (UPF0747 family)